MTPWTVRVNRWNESYLEEVNGETFDKLGAKLTLDQAFHGKLSEVDTLYIFAGTDSGHLVAYVNSLPPPVGTRYLFVELDAALEWLSSIDALKDLQPHITVAPVSSWLEAAENCRISDYLFIDSVQVVPSLAAQGTQALDHIELATLLQDEVGQLRWQVVANLGSEAFIVCQLANAADNFAPAGLWRNAYSGCTGVLLAGGPSLDAAFDWVKANRHRLVVLAVSRISRRLLDVGIEPDFVVSVDPQAISYDISREMLRFGRSVVFINQYHVHPKLLGQWPHRHFYTGRPLPWPSNLDDKREVAGVGPTVTNTTLAFAGVLGLKRVVLAGVDLCFTPEGHTHAEGSNERKVGPRFNLSGLEVETNDGRQAPTVPAYAMAVDTLANQVPALAPMEIINPAPGAARVHGVAFKPLSDIDLSDTPAPREPGTFQLEAMRTPLQHARAVVRELERRLEELEHLDDQLRHAAKIVDKLFHEDGTIHNRNLRKRLDRLEEELSLEHAELTALVRQFSTAAFLRVLKITQDVEELDSANAQNSLRDYYKVYRKGVERLRNILRLSLDRARLRLRELTGRAGLPELADRWLAIGEPGRWMLWDRMHSELIHPSPQESEALDRLKQAWQLELARENHEVIAALKQVSDFKAATVRMQHLFAQRKADGLRHMVDSLKLSPEGEQAAPYMTLAQGLLADLEGHQDDALAAYDLALQKTQSRDVWMIALSRIAQWALSHGHTDHAKQALGLMAELSPRHRLPYGDLLAATGDLKGSIDVYEQHIQEHPKDPHAIARLIHLLVQAGADEAAHLLYEHLITMESGKDFAQTLGEIFKSPPSTV